MSLPADLLAILRCPRTKSELAVADASLLVEVNRRIAAGEALDALGRAVDEPVESGLVDAERQWLYRIVRQIPRLLPDEAIDLRADPSHPE